MTRFRAHHFAEKADNVPQEPPGCRTAAVHAAAIVNVRDLGEALYVVLGFLPPAITIPGAFGELCYFFLLTPYLGTGSRLLDVKGKGTMNELTIGQVAKEAGVNIETIRYYE